MKTFLPLLITLLIQAFSAFALMAVPVLVPVEPGTPRLSTAGIGAYVLLAYVGAVIGSLSAGALADRFGAIRTSQGALALSAVGLLLTALAPAWLMPAALLIGLGYGPITPASSHLLIRTTPADRRNLVFSVKQTGVPVGVAMSGFLVPPLAVPLGWSWTLGLLALACVAVVIAAQTVQVGLDAFTAADRANRAPLAVSIRSMLTRLVEPLTVIFRHPALRVLAAVSFLLSGIQLSLSSYLVTYLTQEMALTALVAGSLLGLSQIGGVAGRIVWGYLSDRLVKPLVMLSVVAAIVALASAATGAFSLFQWVPPQPLLAALMFVFGATASGWNGVYLAEVARQAPAGTAGKATSGTLALTFMGVILGAPLFGLVAAGPGGFAAAFGMQALMALGVAVLLFAIRKRDR